MTTTPDYRLIARHAVPVKGDCYDCDMVWGGPDSREMARAHREVTGHATWVECTPASIHEEHSP